MCVAWKYKTNYFSTLKWKVIFTIIASNWNILYPTWCCRVAVIHEWDLLHAGHLLTSSMCLTRQLLQTNKNNIILFLKTSHYQQQCYSQKILFKGQSGPWRLVLGANFFFRKEANT